jgi:hypothetical protein
MARKAGGVARIVSGVMGDVDVRKSDRPDNESPEQSSEHRRGESVGPAEGIRPGNRSGADDLCLHDRIRGWDEAEYRLPDMVSPPPEAELPDGLLSGQKAH